MPLSDYLWAIFIRKTYVQHLRARTHSCQPSYCFRISLYWKYPRSSSSWEHSCSTSYSSRNKNTFTPRVTVSVLLSSIGNTPALRITPTLQFVLLLREIQKLRLYESFSKKEEYWFFYEWLLRQGTPSGD